MKIDSVSPPMPSRIVSAKIQTSQKRPKAMAESDKVKAIVTFRGREIQHSSLAEVLLKRMAEDMKEISEVQQYPKREGRNMTMFLAPKK